jgi:hypothetical protein
MCLLLYKYIIEISYKLHSFRANSTTAIWNPKQMQIIGMLFNLAYYIVAILPSIPQSPKPPGTIIAFIP